MPSGANRKESKAEMKVRPSSGNVFEDLGIPESTQAYARAELAGQIVAIINERGLTQAQAARLLGIDQPGVSDLVRGKLARFSTERLFRLLGALGQDVEIHVRPVPARRSTPRIRVFAARRGSGAKTKSSRKAS